MASTTKAAELKAIKKLRWPKNLEQGSLSVRDGYRTGQIIREKIGAGRGGDAKVSVIDVVKVLGSSTSTIYRALMVYDVVTQYGLEKRIDDLPATLLYNLPRLPPNQRAAFLKKALAENWSKREITRQAALKDPKVRKTPARRKPARDPALAPQLKRLARVAKLAELPASMPPKAEMTREELKEAKSNVRDLQRFLKKWEKALA